MKLLIIPSWYPHPDDRINGSFFQEQARLVSGHVDVKVLFFRFCDRPSLRSLLREPTRTVSAWLRFLFQGRTSTALPDEELFRHPPLIDYVAPVIAFTRRQRYRQCLEFYLEAVAEMIARGWKPDLIHAHSVNLGGLVARRIKEVHGIPFVITEHSPFALNNFHDYMREDIRATFREADLVLSLGYDKVRQLGISGIEVEPHLIYNYVDETFFRTLCSPYQPRTPLRLTTIGAASHYKDHRTLLRAVALLKARQIPFTLSLVGLRIWGPLYDEILQQIRDQGLTDDVHLIDRLDRAEVPGHLARQNVFLLTSIQEGFPVSVLEALATGLYVVATRHGGTEDVLPPTSGTLVEIKNSSRIADCLEDLYHGRITFDPATIRQHIVSVCGTDAFRQRLLGYYRQAARKT
jgi:teichuronic acid biosynthesis glycosyltransferase TuaC